MHEQTSAPGIDPLEPTLEPALEAALAQSTPPDYYQISHYRTLVRTLSEIHQRRSELHVRLDYDFRQYKYYSIVQQVAEDSQQLVLHQLRPTHWRDVITEPRLVEVSSFLPSGILRFNTTIAPMKEDELFCTLAFPQIIAKTQQRSSYRVPLVTQNIQAQLITPVGEPLTGKAVDFSVEGCCLQLSADLLDRIGGESVDQGPDHADLCRVSFTLGRALSIDAEVKVCRIRSITHHRLLVGLQFVALDPQLRRRLQSALLAIERQQLRRQTAIPQGT